MAGASKAKNGTKIRKSTGDRIVDIIIYVALGLIALSTVLPFQRAQLADEHGYLYHAVRRRYDPYLSGRAGIRHAGYLVGADPSGCYQSF